MQDLAAAQTQARQAGGRSHALEDVRAPRPGRARLSLAQVPGLGDFAARAARAAAPPRPARAPRLRLRCPSRQALRMPLAAAARFPTPYSASTCSHMSLARL